MAAVVAETRAQAEDAAQHIEAGWEELPAVVDMEDVARRPPVIHADLGDNICFKRELDTGEVDAAFARADVVVEETYEFGRHTGVSLESRAPSSPTTTPPSARSRSTTRPRRRT